MLNASRQKTNVETVELIYDMSSSDPALNWGKTSGIQGNVDVSKDLSKYQAIEIVPVIYPVGSTNTGGWSGRYKLDLTIKKPGDDWYVACYCAAYCDSTNAGFVSRTTWNFAILYNKGGTLRWYISFNGTNYNNSTSAYIAKIYGIKRGGHRKLSLLHRIFHRGGAVC